MMHSEIRIRLAKPTDWQAIIDIFNQGIDDGCNAFTSHISVESQKSWLELHDGKEYAIFVADVNGRIAGWITLSPYRKERKAFGKTGETSYYIDRQYRNKGVGSQLMEFALKKASVYQMNTLMAFLLDINTYSVRLLEKYDFSLWGHFPGIAEVKSGKCGQYVYGINLK
ncbi:MAG: N-acetyltransferase [Bacteroidales bacterium]|nr:N-acetyltransferase [Bacteroidales bacterium]